MSEREEKICSNIGLVHTCARRFIGRGIEYDDLYQAGSMGLVKAVDGFDESRGLKFSTYAVPVILGEIRRLFRDGGTVKVSRTLKELAMRVSRERDAFCLREGREPSVTELSETLGIEREQVAEALGVLLPALSLTRSGEENDGDEVDIPVDSPEEHITDRLALRQLLTELPPPDRSLIEYRYFKRQTQQVTAEKLGMTQVQVSRRERAILRQLREQLIG
ncbi:MAG: sigma-70 family RNA polymerase sigma factor [Clostridia bacterium]|nr:sigma-70 family RNA polymerase sigma factor [Clostridia bacterium]